VSKIGQTSSPIRHTWGKWSHLVPKPCPLGLECKVADPNSLHLDLGRP
jgi:hypothetical protein